MKKRGLFFNRSLFHSLAQYGKNVLLNDNFLEDNAINTLSNSGTSFMEWEGGGGAEPPPPPNILSTKYIFLWVCGNSKLRNGNSKLQIY